MRENLCSLVVRLMTPTCKITPGSKYHVTVAQGTAPYGLLFAERAHPGNSE